MWLVVAPDPVLPSPKFHVTFGMACPEGLVVEVLVNWVGVP